jgi:uncharacterized protein (TIGR03437 family)
MVVNTSSKRTPATFTVYARATSPRVLGAALVLRPAHGDPLTIPVTQEYILQSYTPTITSISPVSLTFTATQGTDPALALLSVTYNTPGDLAPNVTANVISDKNWLRVNGDFFGTTPLFAHFPAANLGITCVCTQLPVGTYKGVVNVESGSSDPLSSVPVTLTVSPPASRGLAAATAALSFDHQIGGTLPPAQNVVVSSITAGATSTFTAAASAQGGGWLSVAPASVTTPANIAVSVNPSGLGPANYSGTVTLTPTTGTAITIAVTLTVRAAAPISASAANLSFSYRQGDPLPSSQTIQISGGGASPSFTVQVPDTATWLKPAPLSATAPATLTVAVDPSMLAPGNYQATLTITGTGSASGTFSIPVTLQVAAPLPTISKIVNAASYAQGGIAPGEIVAIFGSAIGPETLAGLALDSSGKVASTLSQVQVLFDGLPAPLIYVSKAQIAAVAPYEIAGRQDTTVQVSWNSQRSNGMNMPVTTTAPGIFTADSSGTGPGAIVHADGSINSATNPASAGDTIILYVTGEGQTAPKGITGSVTKVSDVPPLTPSPVLAIAVLIGGQSAQFSFAGEAPGFVAGVMQLNGQIPAGLNAGTQPISVGIGGHSSQSGVTVWVK